MMLQLLLECISILLLAQLKPSDGAVLASRTDPNYDVVVYFNGQPLRANSMISLPAFTQTAGIILANGQRIPPNSRGVVNLRIDVLRNGGGGGMAGSAGYGQVPYGGGGGYTTGGYSGGQYGQYGQYGNQGYGSGGYGGGGGYTTPYPYNQYSSTSGFLDFFRRLGK